MASKGEPASFGTKVDFANLTPLVTALVASARLQEQLMAELAREVEREDQEEVFRIARQLTGSRPPSGLVRLSKL